MTIDSLLVILWGLRGRGEQVAGCQPTVVALHLGGAERQPWDPRAGRMLKTPPCSLGGPSRRAAGGKPT